MASTCITVQRYLQYRQQNLTKKHRSPNKTAVFATNLQISQSVHQTIDLFGCEKGPMIFK